MRTNTTPTGTPPPQNNPQIETKTRGYKQTKKHPQNNKQTNKQTKYRQTPINCKVWHQLTKTEISTADQFTTHDGSSNGNQVQQT